VRYFIMSPHALSWIKVCKTCCGVIVVLVVGAAPVVVLWAAVMSMLIGYNCTVLYCTVEV
jgi:hypothetical protein